MAASLHGDGNADYAVDSVDTSRRRVPFGTVRATSCRVHAPSRWISAIAAAGLRSLAALMK
jgi:hypothetical protein